MTVPGAILIVPELDSVSRMERLRPFGPGKYLAIQTPELHDDVSFARECIVDTSHLVAAQDPEQLDTAFVVESWADIYFWLPTRMKVFTLRVVDQYDVDGGTVSVVQAGGSSATGT